MAMLFEGARIPVINKSYEMPADSTVQYGTNILSIRYRLEINEIIKSMSQIFPELKNCNYAVDITINRLYLSVNEGKYMPDIDKDFMTDYNGVNIPYESISSNIEGIKLLKKGDAFG